MALNTHLNIATSYGIVVYEIVRQWDFPDRFHATRTDKQ
jgi:tRNA(Leu) C34 or U34 (ribose-2'-O)-methylase TrmL